MQAYKKILLWSLRIFSEEVFNRIHLSDIWVEYLRWSFFAKINQWLLAGSYFCKNAPSEKFDWVLNTPLNNFKFFRVNNRNVRTGSYIIQSNLFFSLILSKLHVSFLTLNMFTFSQQFLIFHWNEDKVFGRSLYFMNLALRRTCERVYILWTWPSASIFSWKL